MEILPNNLYCGDCVELLKELKDDSVDCVISDVAYKITSRGSCGNMSGFWKEKNSLNGKIFNDNSIEIENYINELYRVLKDKTFCYIMCNNLNFIISFFKGNCELLNYTNCCRCLEYCSDLLNQDYSKLQFLVNQPKPLIQLEHL